LPKSAAGHFNGTKCVQASKATIVSGEQIRRILLLRNE
jgi:hypothetical protein